MAPNESRNRKFVSSAQIIHARARHAMRTAPRMTTRMNHHPTLVTPDTTSAQPTRRMVNTSKAAPTRATRMLSRENFGRIRGYSRLQLFSTVSLGETVIEGSEWQVASLPGQLEE